MLSPVEQFYIDIEELREKERQEALLPAKVRRGRPRKRKLYFTEETEMAIVAYNIEESQRQEKRSSLSQLQERQARWEKRRSRQRGEPQD